MNLGASVWQVLKAGADNRSMDRLIDLDAVAAELMRRRPEWVRRGLAVGEFTWRDTVAAWPQPIVTDRAAVADPESLGLVFRGAGGGEAELVLWCGGWADRTASWEAKSWPRHLSSLMRPGAWRWPSRWPGGCLSLRRARS